MAVMTRGNHPAALWPGIHKWWGVEYARHQQMYPQIFTVETSNQAYEEDVEDVGFGLAAVKNEAGGISYDTAQQGSTKRYTHITYGLGYQVTMEELQDNLYNKVSMKRSSRLARSISETEETIHANIFNRAFNSSFTGGDGKEMVATDHPTASGNQSNEIATASDLSEAAIEDLDIQIGQAVDSRNLKINIKSRCLLVPENLKFEAERLTKSVLQSGTANNDINALRSMSVFPDGVKVWKYLTDTDAWFILTDCPDGLTHFTRMKPMFDKDNDFDTKNAKASVVQRYSAGWTNWRAVYGSPGA